MPRSWLLAASPRRTSAGKVLLRRWAEAIQDRVVIVPSGEAEEHGTNYVDAIFVTWTFVGSPPLKAGRPNRQRFR
jgi:hypothetical protein